MADRYVGTCLHLSGMAWLAFILNSVHMLWRERRERGRERESLQGRAGAQAHMAPRERAFYAATLAEYLAEIWVSFAHTAELGTYFQIS